MKHGHFVFLFFLLSPLAIGQQAIHILSEDREPEQPASCFSYPIFVRNQPDIDLQHSCFCTGDQLTRISIDRSVSTSEPGSFSFMELFRLFPEAKEVTIYWDKRVQLASLIIGSTVLSVVSIESYTHPSIFFPAVFKAEISEKLMDAARCYTKQVNEPSSLKTCSHGYMETASPDKWFYVSQVYRWQTESREYEMCNLRDISIGHGFVFSTYLTQQGEGVPVYGEVRKTSEEKSSSTQSRGLSKRQHINPNSGFSSQDGDDGRDQNQTSDYKQDRSHYLPAPPYQTIQINPDLDDALKMGLDHQGKKPKGRGAAKARRQQSRKYIPVGFQDEARRQPSEPREPTNSR